jgi:hypothetical protein
MNYKLRSLECEQPGTGGNILIGMLQTRPELPGSRGLIYGEQETVSICGSHRNIVIAIIVAIDRYIRQGIAIAVDRLEDKDVSLHGTTADRYIYLRTAPAAEPELDGGWEHITRIGEGSPIAYPVVDGAAIHEGDQGGRERRGSALSGCHTITCKGIGRDLGSIVDTRLHFVVAREELGTRDTVHICVGAHIGAMCTVVKELDPCALDFGAAGAILDYCPALGCVERHQAALSGSCAVPCQRHALIRRGATNSGSQVDRAWEEFSRGKTSTVGGSRNVDAEAA